MDLTLHRDLDDGRCSLGVLTVGAIRYQTIERPWLNNQQGVSCVPVGRYRLMRHTSEAHPHTWALVNPALHVVHFEDPGHPDWRALVLIHVANWSRELRGCCAPGMGRQRYGDSWMVTGSDRAFRAIVATLPWTDDHTLTITSD